uniref:SEFIR domain-containing protein n=1 Tax=Mola mola TaxID=94237 RepID=A0A3Q4B0A1_MOLML
MVIRRTILVLMFVSLSSTLRILKWPPLNCSQHSVFDYVCVCVCVGNCMDKIWLVVNQYTPSSPEELHVSVDTRFDEKGHLQPVLLASWRLKDDGSIRSLKATELHVLVASTNYNLCVRYSFKDELPMRSPTKEKWSFSANMLVVDPGQQYRVSVFNIPKPEVGHSLYDVSANVIVPGCQAHVMKKTQFCVERGSLWQPNIKLAELTAAGGRSLLVSFSPDKLCEEYRVIIRCSTTEQVEQTYKVNQTTPNVTISLDKWPTSCCQFDVEIKPLFQQCGQDCARRKRTLDICPDATLDPVYTFVILGVVFMCVVMVVIMFVIYRKPGDVASTTERGKQSWQEQLKQLPKVLVIYSQDHHLYRDIVLKLCTFLQVKCGVKVLLDLLDSTSVGTVGRLRWLEWQRQKLKDPFDKILVLCSPGVQAKWRAVCGQSRVTLREDILSPTDDMLTPFLSLFLPDLHQAGMLGKYMVAYFEEISSEQDVPSVFDIAVKYKLMKHFEELYFRILDVEKYQPGQVNHIEGISGNEFFNCPSGKALKNAIETFKAYQLENPDWFKSECVDSEEEVITEANIFLDQMQIPPVLECVPLIRKGLPVYIHEVEMNENGSSVHLLTPELNTKCELLSVAELTPVMKAEDKHQYPSNLEQLLTNHMYLCSTSQEPVCMVEPVLSKPQLKRQSWLSLSEEPLKLTPIEDTEEDFILSINQHSIHSDQRSLVLQNSLDSSGLKSSCGSMQSERVTLSEISNSQHVNWKDYEVLEPGGKGHRSGSDQGYISKVSSQHELPFKEDPLVGLKRLQEELLQRNVRYYDIGTEGN